ncbi:adenylate/guanylate cyclase domain-containing protein [Pelagibius sp. Alg239-R121]|uniref:adenylate/guanylate cyclase domain-containing protein n=1 Tax=Pelagibius sp. Alg239-R121 TaxID=2993448 RepID=UPI0024A6BFCE|nr:adenylate/guanylate cyclase domain-containing protein [Pelagibius sp. Alg239-R121]
MAQSVPATLEAAAARISCNTQELSRFSQHLQALPPYLAARINPFEFADAAGVGAETALDLFVHGAKLGLFDLEWGMVCPLCGGITHSVAELDRVAEDTLHCSLCDKDVDSVLDDTVEVSFAYAAAGAPVDLHHDFATYQHFYTSSSYPYREDWRNYHERYTVADVKLESGQSAKLPLSLEAGQKYRLICLDTHSGADLLVAENLPSAEKAQAVELSLTNAGFSCPAITIPAEEAVLTLANHSDLTVWCRALQLNLDDIAAIMGKGPPEFSRRLTGKHLLNNQAFRDNFAMHELAPDLKLKLRSLTLLFTDLKGSTALYDREGDLAAYRLVQDHFIALKQVVRSHSGAVIKTMGDAVMAAFPSGNDGTAAAIAMMGAMQSLAGGRRNNDVGLKVGLHAGPALAINAGQTLDYFGQTVNIAARVQGLADAGEICLTSALNDNDEVPALLTRSGFCGHPELARLKGVSAEEQIFRYRLGS